MADTSTTHLNLIKQDANAAPDIDKEHSNLDTLDSEIWARGKAFNGTTVSSDGEFHVQTVPYAGNLDTSYAQKSNETYIVRTTGGEASLSDGDAWLMLLKGARTHTGYTPQSVTMTVTQMEREETQEGISATIDEDTFVSYVSNSGTTTLTYSTAWSADPANYGITVTGTPIAGDVITVVYVKEVRGTITQSNPATFVSCGWNLYNHTAGYARVIKYSTQYNFKIAGTYTALEFSTTPTGSRTTITPISGGFSIPSDGYIHVTGGNATDTVIWMTWSDWGSGYNWTGTEQGDFEAYEEFEIDFSSFMAQRFPYGLMQVGSVHDEINLNVGVATSRVERLAYNSTNLASAKASGREFEYDENYIYIEKATADTYDFEVDGDYTAFDHGMEWFTGTDQAVYAETIYGANLKNKLERDVLTISQQTLTYNEQENVKANIGFSFKSLGSFSTESALATALNAEMATMRSITQKNIYFNFSAANGAFSALYYQGQLFSSNYGNNGSLRVMPLNSPSNPGFVTGSKNATTGWMFSKPGTILSGTNATSLSVPSETFTEISSVTVPAGQWILVGGHQWSSGFTGLCSCHFRYGTGTNSIGGTTTRYANSGYQGGVNVTGILSCSEDTSVRLTAYQTSGSAKTASYVSLKAIRIA